MDGTRDGQISLRPPEDIAGEGMWRIASGESCKQCWEELPEDQKEWWRGCALRAVKEWLGGHLARRGWLR
jgi:hypothetical protein